MGSRLRAGRSPSWGTSPSELWCTVCRRLFSLLKVPLALRRRPCYSGRWRTSASARRMRVPQGSWRAWSPPLCQRGAGLLARESQTLSGRSLSSGTSRKTRSFSTPSARLCTGASGHGSEPRATNAVIPLAAGALPLGQCPAGDLGAVPALPSILHSEGIHAARRPLQLFRPRAQAAGRELRRRLHHVTEEDPERSAATLTARTATPSPLEAHMIFYCTNVLNPQPEDPRQE